tara:strand:+ start:1011 stop:1730 length:720 start_codon:yes stop_codon:yes gene_type:complete
MGISRGKKIVTDGLIFYIDAANPKSYVSDSTTCSNLRSDTIEGTLINGTAFSTDNNGVFDFDGTNDYINFGDLDAVNLIGSWSWNFWVLNDTWQAYIHILSKLSSGYVGWRFQLMIHASGGGFLTLVTYNGTNANSLFNASGELSLGVWHNICITYNDGDTKPLYYLDNISQDWSYQLGGAYRNYWIPPLSSDDNFMIGTSAARAQTHNGKLSNVSYYNRALSTAEVSQNYNVLKSRFI